MKHFSIGQFSKMIGVPVPTLRLWDNNGKLKAILISPTGRRYYSQEQANEYLGIQPKARVNVGYVRVSSSKQRDDLVRQKQLVENKLSQMEPSYIIIEDVGSGINYKKDGLKQLIAMLLNKEVDTVVVLHKDRLLRFGYELVDYIAELNHSSIHVMNPIDESNEQGLVNDLVQIITVFGARLNGKRSHQIKNLTKDIENND